MWWHARQSEKKGKCDGKLDLHAEFISFFLNYGYWIIYGASMYYLVIDYQVLHLVANRLQLHFKQWDPIIIYLLVDITVIPPPFLIMSGVSPVGSFRVRISNSTCAGFSVIALATILPIRRILCGHCLSM